MLFSLLRKAGPLLEGMFDEYWRTSTGADVLIASTMVFGIPDYAEKRGIPLINALYGAKILSIARNRSGRLPVIIVDDTSPVLGSAELTILGEV